MALRNRNAPKARALTASAVQVDVGNKAQAIKIRRLRQSWQEDAWSYRDAIPEIRYAMGFKSTAVSRMRLFPAMWVDGEDQPVPLDENPAGLPAGLSDAASEALASLATGRMGHANLLRNQSENTEVAGECFLLGQEDPETGEQEFSIRSIDELVVDGEGKYLLRSLPGGSGSSAGGKPVDPNAYIARLWTPHPRFSELADSPMRALLEPCEELVILSRMIRGSARSRYSSAGILGIADELSFASTTDGGDDDDPESDPFFGMLVESMTTAISDEASAAGVVPIIIRGPAELLDKGIVFKDPAREFDNKASALRQELLGRIANGLDIPREILTGVADLNHWTAWQVDDSTFRYHIEPAVLRAVDSLTVGYLRPRLVSQGFDLEAIKRLVIWYDPTELVTHPDRSADAQALWDREAISNAALREATGFGDDDAPDDDELLLRMLLKSRTFAPNLQEALFHHTAPNLVIPADKNEPGMGPGGVVAPDDAAPAVAPKAPAPAIEGPAKTAPPSGPASGPPAVSASARVMAALTAAGRVDTKRSARLARIDASLRDRMVAAADTAMHRALERAGNRVKGKAPNALKASLSGVTPERICAELGPAVIASYGMTEHSLLADVFASLKDRFAGWIDSAFRSALTTAVGMVGFTVDNPHVRGARQRQEASGAAAWEWLQSALQARASYLLYNPQSTDADDTETAASAALVPVGLIRGALALAGGYAGHGLTDTGQPVDATTPLTGIGSGPIITGVLTAGGADLDHYVWVHGISDHPFEPHLALDGTEFDHFNAETLANTDATWVGNAFFFPGDHDGCSCDVQLMWSGPAGDGYGLAASADAV